MTKITLENKYGVFSVEYKSELNNINDLFENLVEPVLLSAGYSKELINDYFENE